MANTAVKDTERAIVRYLERLAFEANERGEVLSEHAEGLREAISAIESGDYKRDTREMCVHCTLHVEDGDRVCVLCDMAGCR
jgi:hypothetical protein